MTDTPERIDPWEAGPEPPKAGYMDADVLSPAWTARRQRWDAWYAQQQASTWFAEHGGLEAKISDLEFPPPTCAQCQGDLEYDDGWSCEACHVRWDSNGSGGWLDEDDVAIAALAIMEGDEACGHRDPSGARNVRPCAMPPEHAPYLHTDGTFAWKG